MDSRQPKNKNVKIAVALSGGVDSGVTAGLLKKQRFDCTGIHLKLCPGVSSRYEKSAKKIAQKLKIPMVTLDFIGLFGKRVVDYFVKSYSRGLTPNPCVVCNRQVKFGWLLEYVKGKGFDYLATGHYARRVISEQRTANSNQGEEKLQKNNYSEGRSIDPQDDIKERKQNKNYRLANSDYRPAIRDIKLLNPDHRSPKKYESSPNPDHWSSIPVYHLLQAKDKTKDQSYFLYRLTQKELKRVLFPVGNYTKNEVREMAKAWGLPVAESRESQDVCFLNTVGKDRFLAQTIPEKIVPGEVVNSKGEVIGRHQGLPLYTIGQRKGFEIFPEYQRKTDGKMPSLFVVEKKLGTNQLVVGTKEEAMRKEFLVGDLSFISDQSPVISDQRGGKDNRHSEAEASAEKSRPEVEDRSRPIRHSEERSDEESRRVASEVKSTGSFSRVEDSTFLQDDGFSIFVKIRSAGKLLQVSQLTTNNLQLSTYTSEVGKDSRHSDPEQSRMGKNPVLTISELAQRGPSVSTGRVGTQEDAAYKTTSEVTRPRPSRPVLDRVETRSGDEVGKSSNILEVKIKVVLKNPAFGVAPGQSAVFYRPWEKEEGSFEVLGGGIIR